MKKYLLLLSIGMWSCCPAFGQPSGVLQRIPPRPLGPPAADSNPEPSLPRFDLDFPDGTPKDLVKAIEKATHGPLNAIIPEEDMNLHLPPISVKSVTVPDLFRALQAASSKVENYVTGYNYGPFGRTPSYQTHQTYYAFRTETPMDEHAIWSFYWEKVLLPPSVSDPAPPQTCRFYQLSPYLDAGYKVEDITTAIRTGWDMLGETNAPKMSYHKDTKLLIAVGEEYKLNLIAQVLAQLRTDKSKPNSAAPASKPKPEAKSEEKKSEPE